MPPRKPQHDEKNPLLLESPLAPPPRRTRSRRTDVVGERAGAPAAELPADVVIARHARRTHIKRELTGITLLLGALFVAGALVFGRAPGLAESCAAAGGPFGPVGGCIRWSILGLLGAVAAVIIPLVPAVHALRLLGRVEESDDRRFLFLTIGLAVIVPVAVGLPRLGTLAAGVSDTLAGLWGSFAAFYLAQALGNGGAWFIVAIGISGLLAITVGWNPVRALLGIGVRRGHDVHHEGTKGTQTTTAEAMEPDAAEMPEFDPSLMGLAGAGATAREKAVKVSKTIADEDALELDLEDEPLLSKRARVGGKKGMKEDATSILHPSSFIPESDELPDPALLTPAPERNTEAGRAQLDLMGAKLIDSLKTFKVDGILTGRTSGPTVTQFEIEPAPGVKVRQFANLANDLALAMRAPSIRVVAPIPGKGAVGIEVPNPSPEMVAFREMLESREYQGKPMALPIALGKDLEGRAVVNDLAKMPHLLIAGATGSGKSVCVNTIITSLIYRHTPKTLRFLMVDPKMVELSVYNVLPHLRHKVVTDNRDAAAVLKWAVLEMQERYALLA